MFFEFDIKTQKLMIFDPAAGQKGEAAQVRELPQQDFRCTKIKQEIARLLKMESGGKAIPGDHAERPSATAALVPHRDADDHG